ncbi:MAG: AraC family transcriptional regulator [Pirellulales bacterium]|nr:AraC family transcriptional regulator [Pirellulales bacterium]
MPKTNQYYRYLPISPRDRQWGLYVTGAGWRNVSPNSLYPQRDHVHPPSHEFRWPRGRSFHEYAVVYISDGQGEFESNETGRLGVGPGAAFLLFPDVWHRYRPLRDIGWREYWVTFHGDMAERMRRHGFISPDTPVFDAGVDDEILRAFTAIFDRLESQTAGFQQLIAADTLRILAAILAARQNRRADDRTRDLVRRARASIEGHTETLPMIEHLADSLGVSAGHLRRVFKQHTGLSPYQYHLQMKIGRAKMMLRASDLPIKHIAQQLGFQNVHHFSKLFKKVAAVPPHRWRIGSQRPISE